MPLHLLGKKSWNVYNTDNISRVRRDEAAFEASESLRRKRRETHEAAVRLALLRGETPPPSPPPSPAEDHHPATSTASDRRKRRRLAGEDDTDRDIRLACGDGQRQPSRSPPRRPKVQNTLPLEDERGNIQLFTETKFNPAPRQQTQDDEGMRFRDAAGYGKGHDKPWYASRGEREVVGRDAFGREDERRGERDARRMAGADPLAAMRRAQGTLRAVKAEREERRRRGSDEGLEGFSLDAQSEAGRREERKHRRERSPREERRRRRSRSPRRHREGERRHRRER